MVGSFARLILFASPLPLASPQNSARDVAAAPAPLQGSAASEGVEMAFSEGGGPSQKAAGLLRSPRAF
eukprot:1702254-Pyramimonas_sp.AAC.1